MVSSNINEVIKSNFRLLYPKISPAQKAQKAYNQTKIKNALKKNLRGKRSRIYLFALFMPLLGCVFVSFGTFGAIGAIGGFGPCEIFS